MRIALVGSHRVGKTTLAHAVADALPDHEFVEEPYHQLATDGHLFSHPPGAEDFEAQLDYSIALLREGVEQAVFDRCPLDLLAYLMSASDDPAEILEAWRDPVRSSLGSLDAIVHVPIETPERIEFGEEEDATASRTRVDEIVLELLQDDGLRAGVPFLTVGGTVEQRLAAVRAWIGAGRADATDDLRAVISPLESLLRKSEKSLRKVPPGSWQQERLQTDVRALRIALSQMAAPHDPVSPPSVDDLRAGVGALASMEAKTVRAQARVRPGSSQSTLLRNRLAALGVAHARLVAALDRRGAAPEGAP